MSLESNRKADYIHTTNWRSDVIVPFLMFLFGCVILSLSSFSTKSKIESKAYENQSQTLVINAYEDFELLD